MAIAAWIGQGGPRAQPDVIADTYWDLVAGRSEPELFHFDETMAG